MNLRDIQREAWANKLAKGFNTTDVPLEFCLLSREVSEAFDAWKIGHDQELGLELADVAIFLVSLAEMTSIDLQSAVEAKLAINAGREYMQLPNGTYVKAGAA